VDLTEFQEFHLLHGGFTLLAGFVDRDMMEDAWQAHRPRLLREYIAQKPGRRPLAWWLFEGVPRYGERPVIREVRPEYLEREREQTHGLLHTHTHLPIQEPEADFLRRHGVLSRAEWERAQERREEARRRDEEFRRKAKWIGAKSGR
jgi:hypothetical protein